MMLISFQKGDSMKSFFGVIMFLIVSQSYTSTAHACRLGDLKSCQQEASQGDTAAQTTLGLMYDNGQGVAQDYKQAFKWFSKAAL